MNKQEKALLIILLFLSSLLISCTTAAPPVQPAPIPSVTPAADIPHPIAEPAEIIIEQIEPPEPPIIINPIMLEDIAAFLEKQKSVPTEFERSVQAAKEEGITKDDFEIDKKAILDSITQLTKIMQNKDYSKWLKYVSPGSIQYWSTPKNLTLISSMLPIKGLRLRSLEDYFTLVFLPSRLNRVVDEIRYVSKTLVKAVQVQNDQDIIYYYFEKINDKWLLRLDTIDK